MRIDAVCNVFGRYEGQAPGAPAILLGSHIDTVVDAGTYDGNLGVLAAIAVVADWRARGERLDHAIEVVAFGEEEGSRFPTHILTSSRADRRAWSPPCSTCRTATASACARRWPRPAATPRPIARCARKKGEIAAYLELHIEQGPVLDDKGLRAAPPSPPSTAPSA